MPLSLFLNGGVALFWTLYHQFFLFFSSPLYIIPFTRISFFISLLPHLTSYLLHFLSVFLLTLFHYFFPFSSSPSLHRTNSYSLLTGHHHSRSLLIQISFSLSFLTFCSLSSLFPSILSTEPLQLKCFHFISI